MGYVHGSTSLTVNGYINVFKKAISQAPSIDARMVQKEMFMSREIIRTALLTACYDKPEVKEAFRRLTDLEWSVSPSVVISVFTIL